LQDKQALLNQALVDAVQLDDVDEVINLCNNGADPNVLVAPDNTPLSEVACSKRSFRMLRALVERWVDIATYLACWQCLDCSLLDC
jgi:hypothetical protein